MPDKPLIIQSDFTLLLEVKSTLFKEAREEICTFLELVKSPELFYTYKMTAVSLWNGFSLKLDDKTIISILSKYSRYPVPEIISQFVNETFSNYGIFKLKPHTDDHIEVFCEDRELIKDIAQTRSISEYITTSGKTGPYLIPTALRGIFKLDMIELNYPVEDLAGYIDGDDFPLSLEEKDDFSIRSYQQEAVDSFFGSREKNEGAGILVLPCGAGKTVVGMMVMSRIGAKTLIVTPNIVALRQWKQELVEKTSLRPENIGEYSGEVKDIRPVTITTYQILVYRKNKQADFLHFELFNKEKWGLIIYDEIHLLPAPVFRAIASIQATRRLGLTATLIREDRHEKDVFTLVGPKKYDLPWKELESTEFIANATCLEVKVPLSRSSIQSYFEQNDKNKFRIASENPLKRDYLEQLLEKLKNHNVLIIGQYLDQLNMLADYFEVPLITGKTDNLTRQKLYAQFKSGKLKQLVVSKVANFAIDLPDADVAIQVSGTFGSRQEEAQRLGRIIRPKANGNKAWFFNLVTSDTREEFFAQNRKRFLMEQGYRYLEVKADEVADLNIESLSDSSQRSAG